MDNLFINGVGFPSSVMVNIMKRLSAKELRKFLEVSYDWFQTIVGNNFCRIHYEFTRSIYGFDVLDCTRYKEYLADNVNIKVSRDLEPQKYISFFKVHPSISFAHRPAIIGITYGVVCCLYDSIPKYIEAESIAICNPSTSQIILTDFPTLASDTGMKLFFFHGFHGFHDFLIMSLYFHFISFRGSQLFLRC